MAGSSTALIRCALPRRFFFTWCGISLRREVGGLTTPRNGGRRTPHTPPIRCMNVKTKGIENGQFVSERKERARTIVVQRGGLSSRMGNARWNFEVSRERVNRDPHPP